MQEAQIECSHWLPNQEIQNGRRIVFAFDNFTLNQVGLERNDKGSPPPSLRFAAGLEAALKLRA